MWRALRVVLVALTLAVAGFAFAGEAFAQGTRPANLADDEEFMQRYREWRASIPDYDRRLYDRVASTQKYTLDALRLSGASILVSLGVLGALAYLLFRRPFGGSALAGEKAGTSGQNDYPMDSKTQRSLVRVGKRQDELLRLMARIETALTAHQWNLEQFQREHEQFRRLADDCSRAAAILQTEIASLQSEPVAGQEIKVGPQ